MRESQEQRFDGWMNLLSGLGLKARARSQNTIVARTLDFLDNEETLNTIYEEDGFGSRVINAPVEDMTRAWFTVSGDSENYVNQVLETIHAKEKIIDALTQASLHGGAIGVMGIDDGGEYQEPVNESAIRKLTHIHVFNRWRVNVQTANYYTDYRNPKFNQPELYDVTPLGVTGAGTFQVHESRILRFEGSPCSDLTRIRNNGWANSDLKVGYERLRGLGESFAGIEHIISEFVLGILRMKNLQALIASGKEDKVKARLDLIDLTKHIMNSLLLDENEEYSRMGMPVTGLAELLVQCYNAISAAYGIPVTILMGQAPAGLNATGESDIRRYYDKISARQELRMRGQLEMLIKYVMLSQESEFNGKELDEWSIVFNPLWAPTQNEIVDMRYKQAQTDVLYIENNVLSAATVTKSRFMGEQYSIETKIEPEDELEREEITPEETETETEGNEK